MMSFEKIKVISANIFSYVIDLDHSNLKIKLNVAW
jgi:hypothetical protein